MKRGSRIGESNRNATKLHFIVPPDFLSAHDRITFIISLLPAGQMPDDDAIGQLDREAEHDGR